MKKIQRTPEHKKETIALKAIEAMIAKWGWTSIEIKNDYGEDLMLRIRPFEDTHPLGRFFQIQVKAMGSIDKYLLSDGITISYPIETKHLSSWLTIPEPVLLVVYDLKTGKAFWTHVQEYILEKLDLKNPSWKTQNTVKVPIYTDKSFSDKNSTPEALKSLKNYSVEALIREAMVCIENRDDIKAIKCLNQAKRLNPDFIAQKFIFTELLKLKSPKKSDALRNESDLENYVSIVSLLDDYAELSIAYAKARKEANFVDRLDYLCPLPLASIMQLFLTLRSLRKSDKRLIKFDQFIAKSISDFLQKEPKCVLIGNAHILFLFNAGCYLLEAGQQELAYQCFKQMFIRLPELGKEEAEDEIKWIYEEANGENNKIFTTSPELLRKILYEAQKDSYSSQNQEMDSQNR